MFKFVALKEAGVLDGDMLAEAMIWAAMAGLAWNFKGIAARFPNVLLGLQESRLTLPTRYARLLIGLLAGWEILLNCESLGQWLPLVCYAVVAAVWLRHGWEYEGEAHLHWLGTFACGTAIVLLWQSLLA